MPEPPQSSTQPVTAEPPPTKIPLFGARSHARKTATELCDARAELNVTRQELSRAREALKSLRSEMDRLGMLDLIELERERETLLAEIDAQRAQLAHEKAAAVQDIERRREEFAQAKTGIEQELAELRKVVVTTQETAILQEAGVYEYRHPLGDSIAYKDELARLQTQIKTACRADGNAILAAHGWTVNGSQAEGKRMVRDFSKLMLRAYNAEADNLVRGLKPYKLETAVERLEKVAATIERLGKTMDIRVTQNYHGLRVRELELTADYQEKLAREKEQEREEKARLREERKVQQEMERERQRLDKERQHYTNALEALIAKGDHDGADRMRAQLEDIDKAIADVDYRAANARAGYVYVISNLGAFGEHMIKVGLTRRLDPMDRIRELSDASVPFNFDVHALFFAEDAVGIESQMHQRLADRRVNRVNLRREFFYATPSEAREHLMALTGEMLKFEETPEAVEFHQSRDGRPASRKEVAA